MNKAAQLFTVRIRTKSNAFHRRAAYEVAFLLRQLARHLEEDPANTGQEKDIRDTNGEVCGSMKFDHTDTDRA